MAGPDEQRSDEPVGPQSLPDAIRRLAGIPSGASEEEVQRVFFEGLFEESLEALCLLAADGRILRVNGAFEHLFGFSNVDCAGKDIDDLILSPEQRDTGKELTRTVDQGGQVTTEGVRLTRSGEELDVSIMAQPVSYGDKQVGTYVIYRNISERKRAESAMKEAMTVVEAANTAKTQFLANMSHEIRTPMNAIIGMADLLAETSLTDEQRQYIEIFRSAGQTLLTLINDLLDLSKIEAGNIEIEAVPFRVEELVGDVLRVFGVAAHRKNLELVAQIEPDLPPAVGDPTRLKQVLNNLLGNAIKFTNTGEVGVQVRTEPMEEAQDGSFALHVDVWDTGCGIPEAKVSEIFERFVQADATTTRKYGGSGLGLTISKYLIELMGGWIWAKSVVDEGSRFSLVVPLALGSSQELPPTANPPGLGNLRILVVDDHPTNRLILREILEGWGATVFEAEDGPTALERSAEAVGAGEAYDLMFLDGHMPSMDGFEVARRISEDPSLKAIPVLMLTSLDRPGDIALSRHVNIKAYLVKPIQRDGLARALSRVLALGPATTVVDEEPSPESIDEKVPASEVARLLVVEDVDDNQLLVELYLKDVPVELTIASNGAEAVEHFENDEAFSLILMDVQMPVMDGYEATRRIRRIEAERGGPPVPIIALTAHALHEERAAILDAGCDDHMTKPIRKADLIDAVRRYCTLPES